MVYYSLTLNVGSFGSNIYVTQVIFGATELPSFLSSYFISQCLGRRPSQIGFLVLAGAACLLILAIPEGNVQLFLLSTLYTVEFCTFTHVKQRREVVLCYTV